MNAVDTNVYVYALDANEAAKQPKAIDLFDQLMLKPTETVLLWQVAAEFLGQLRKWESRGKLAPAAVEPAFGRFRVMFPVRIPSERVLEISFDLRSRFHLSHWDSMILAACKEAGVTTLYSEDLDAGTNYDGLPSSIRSSDAWRSQRRHCHQPQHTSGLLREHHYRESREATTVSRRSIRDQPLV